MTIFTLRVIGRFAPNSAEACRRRQAEEDSKKSVRRIYPSLRQALIELQDVGISVAYRSTRFKSVPTDKLNQAYMDLNAREKSKCE